ncbi:uncharacterized protein LOC116350290 isoform X2 [Contarinia nasturtii]|uniref:uncharacterized protein LOC116350290 isoform X2 n=1 Tax=Contarinia nasturtii TaxID=265458 RepID=UPI0012D42B34|nr:uncharacterized protein LOC116350290 isoform X2 [Contarinia nasturtii]
MQVDILEHLEKGKANLDDYYKQRAQWAQFIMGVSAPSLVDQQVPNSTVDRQVPNSTVKRKVPNSTVRRKVLDSPVRRKPNKTRETITYQYLIEKLHEKATKVFFEYALTPMFTLCEDDVVSYITTSLDSFIEFFSSISLDAELLKNKNVAQINVKWVEMVAQCNDIKLYLTTYATISAHVPHEIQSIYNTWQSSSISSSQEEDIETNLSGIKEVHGIYHKAFIGLIHELIGQFLNFGEATNDIYNELLTSDLNRLKKKLLIYNRSQDEITYKFENALKILQNYCDRRINWAKSIMGIPITL